MTDTTKVRDVFSGLRGSHDKEELEMRAEWADQPTRFREEAMNNLWERHVGERAALLDSLLNDHREEVLIYLGERLGLKI